ncbi:MAG: hypothetical protein K2Y71_07545 [Xanthobacteraceae bacterium]|nr:hypothetical protein [Xanthobacteraceae bacterium]
MKVLVSAMALAIALAWPTVGEAQSKKSKARSATQTQQQYGQRNVRAKRTTTARPCVAQTWHGCLGWDPDPHVRSMIQRDANLDDL